MAIRNVSEEGMHLFLGKDLNQRPAAVLSEPVSSALSNAILVTWVCLATCISFDSSKGQSKTYVLWRGVDFAFVFQCWGAPVEGIQQVETLPRVSAAPASKCCASVLWPHHLLITGAKFFRRWTQAQSFVQASTFYKKTDFKTFQPRA